MLYHSKTPRTGLKRGIFFTVLLSSLAQEALAVTPTTNVASLIISGRQSARPAGTYSAGISEIIKMLDAKIDAPVILAFIQNSPIPYNPDAAELIGLKEHNASTQLLMAVLHRGDELRLQLAQSQSAVNLPPATQAYDPAPTEPYPVYPSSYPDSSDGSNPATYFSYGWAYNAYRPYCYANGRFFAPHNEGRRVPEGDHAPVAKAAAPVSQSAYPADTPIDGSEASGSPSGDSPGSGSSSYLDSSYGSYPAPYLSSGWVYNACRPYCYANGHFSAPHNEGHREGQRVRDGGQAAVATPATPVSQSTHPASAPISGRTGTSGLHSGGLRSSSRSSGRSGGRSR